MKYLVYYLQVIFGEFILFTDPKNLLQEDKCNVVLEAYVKYLIEEDHKELVSFYVSKLPPAAQVHWYALFLEGKAAENLYHFLYMISLVWNISIHQLNLLWNVSNVHLCIVVHKYVHCCNSVSVLNQWNLQELE